MTWRSLKKIPFLGLADHQIPETSISATTSTVLKKYEELKKKYNIIMEEKEKLEIQKDEFIKTIEYLKKRKRKRKRSATKKT